MKDMKINCRCNHARKKERSHLEPERFFYVPGTQRDTLNIIIKLVGYLKIEILTTYIITLDVLNMYSNTRNIFFYNNRV